MPTGKVSRAVFHIRKPAGDNMKPTRSSRSETSRQHRSPVYPMTARAKSIRINVIAGDHIARHVMIKAHFTGLLFPAFMPRSFAPAPDRTLLTATLPAGVKQTATEPPPLIRKNARPLTEKSGAIIYDNDGTTCSPSLREQLPELRHSRLSLRGCGECGPLPRELRRHCRSR